MHFALNYKNKPFLGVVLIPEKDELWISNGNMYGVREEIVQEVKLNLTVKNSISNMILVTSKNHCNETLINLLKNY